MPRVPFLSEAAVYTGKGLERGYEGTKKLYGWGTRTLRTLAIVGLIAFVGGTAVGGIDGFNDYRQRFGDFVGRKTNRPVGINAHSREFRLENYFFDELHPDHIVYETFFEGNFFDRFPADRRGRRVVIRFDPPFEDDARKEFGELATALGKCEGSIIVEVERPTPADLMRGVQIPEREFNDELQLFVNNSDFINYHCYHPISTGPRPRVGRP